MSMPKFSTAEEFLSYVRHETVPLFTRPGVLAFNLLRAARPDLAEEAWGKPGVDPFNDDSALPAFADWVIESWSTGARAPRESSNGDV